MGHWERDYGAEEEGGEYVYPQDGVPTLLAAGYVSKEIKGAEKVEIEMRPLVVDTVFKAPGDEVSEVHPEVGEGVELAAVGWEVQWTLGGEGFGMLLAAEGAGGSVTALGGRGQALIVDGEGVEDPAGTLAGNIFTADLGSYTKGLSKTGDSRAVNFNVEYIPFNVGEGEAWDSYRGDGLISNMREGGPVWVIRNGVNDLAQDGDTDFSQVGQIPEGSAVRRNGNGAVQFTVAAVSVNKTLKITDGVFENPGTTRPNAYIGFTTSGYTGKADVYYAVVNHDGSAPELAGYSYLDSLGPEVHSGKEISLEVGGTVYPNADVYVLLMKNGNISDPIFIQTGTNWNWNDDGTGVPVKSITMTSAANTPENVPLTLTGTVSPANATWQNIAWEIVEVAGATGAKIERSGDTYTLTSPAAGTVRVRATVPHALWETSPAYKDFNIEVGMDWTGGSYGASYKTWYVSSSGNDTWTGSSTSSPLATVDKALEKIKAAYAAASSWSLNRPAEISIVGTVTATSTITIDNRDNTYPPIRLTSGTLQGKKAPVIRLYDTVLILDGVNIKPAQTGVYQGILAGTSTGSGSRLIMNSGEISGFKGGEQGKAGAGVEVDGGWFFMNGGEISDNRCFEGGGEWIDLGTFHMNDGKISNNAAFHGGGVIFSIAGGTFIMTGGEISGNRASALTGDTTIYNYTTYNMTPEWSAGGGIFAYYNYMKGPQDTRIAIIGGTIKDNTVSTSTTSTTSTTTGRGAQIAIQDGTNSISKLPYKREAPVKETDYLYYHHNGVTADDDSISSWKD
jgi:hypothetical protein